MKLLRRVDRSVAITLLALPFFASTLAAAAATGPQHAIAMYGDVKYPADFTHFAYANPDAPKGGALALSGSGTFDSLNPFILRGTPAAGVTLIFETLMTPSLDEPFTYYGLVAETVETPEDRSWVKFTINPNARWHDGKPITVEDVIFSFETLTTKGHPQYRSYYANVVSAEKTGEREVTFTFDGEVNRELPLIMGQLPVLPKHYYAERDFEKTSLEPPLGSGPYKIRSLEPGRSIVYERVRDYWGADLPVNRGRNNFDEVRFEYYRDRDVAFEAFKAGNFDLWTENSAKRWATGYEGNAFTSGAIVKEELPIRPPARMQGYLFNLRDDKFKDRRVREALGYAFDFEWANKNLMYDAYERIESYFHGEPDLASSGLPSAAELALLEPYRDQLPEEVFTQEYQPPTTDGSGNNRENLRKALSLLREAGWIVEDGRLTHQQTGEVMAFEILLVDPSGERLAAPWINNLKRLGVDARIRIVDTSQYQNRMDNFDFEVTTELWAQSDSPGNEQRDMWSSALADVPGSRNTAGIKDPVVDALIDKVIAAATREDLETAVRALDRVLLWGHSSCRISSMTASGWRIATSSSGRRPYRRRDLTSSPGGSTPTSSRRWNRVPRRGPPTRPGFGRACLYRSPAAADGPDPARDHGR
jgi:microcin C transport system substrate-binding protein